ncbi:MAG: hypothetical protein M0007_12390 [Actinomycetota bacterium]|nr:hypothetical protein [Actinomycetota bacterium]
MSRTGGSPPELCGLTKAIDDGADDDGFDFVVAVDFVLELQAASNSGNNAGAATPATVTRPAFRRNDRLDSVGGATSKEPSVMG